MPLSSTQRVAGNIADGKARMPAGETFGAACDDWDDAYKTVCVALRDLWLCVFRVWSEDEQCWHYFVVKRMNFGVVGSGFTFGRIAVLVVWVLAVIGLGPELWVDDVLYLGSYKQLAAAQRAADILAQMLGFRWKMAKRVGPAGCVKWIGVDWDIVRHQMRVTPEFLAKITAFIDRDRWAARTHQRRDHLESLLGLLGRAAMAVKNGLMRCFHLRMALRDNKSGWVKISAAACAEAAWWRSIAARWNGVCTLPQAIKDRPREPVGRSDSCEESMGGIWWHERSQVYRYYFHVWCSDRAAALDMCAKECLAAATFIMMYAREQRLQAMPLPAYMMQTDSMVTVQCWERRSAAHSPGVTHALLALDDATTEFDVATYVYLDHIPGVKNPLADAVSRAQWPKLRELTHPFPCVRVPIPVQWTTAWL